MNEVLSLSNLVQLSHSTLPPPPQTLNANLIQCPFDPHHLMPPHSLFRHFLRCPSSPRPLPDPNHLLLSLTYPKTLHNSVDDYDDDKSNLDPRAQLSLSLDHYVDFSSNFFYRDCPAVVSFSGADAINKTFTLPPILSVECANFSGNTNGEIRTSERVQEAILPSEYWAITSEVQAWNDYPSTFSYTLLRAIPGLRISKERDLMRWIIANSPRYGIVIDVAMQQHIFLLFCLCLKSILREAFTSLDVFTSKHNSRLDSMGMISECPILVQALTWLASQLSILYGATNGKLFVLNFIKKCILHGASGLLLFPFEENEVTEAPASNQESQNSETNSGDVKDTKPDTQLEEKTNCMQSYIADGNVWSRKIFVSQVAAAIAALHERSLLEHRIKELWFSQQPSKYQLVAEHCNVSERANAERKKRLNYRPIIDYDGFHRQQSSNQETSREKTQEELLAEERDYKRRRMSYRGKKIKSSALQVMRDVIEEYMEAIKQAGGVESPAKVFEETGMFPSKPLSGHDIPMEANNPRKVNHDSPAATLSNPSYYEQQSRANYYDKSKAVGNVFSRDYEQHRQGHYRNHDFVEDQWDTGRVKYHREYASKSPERHRSQSRSHEHSIHHKKQDYSKKKKYDHLSRTKDRGQRDTDTHKDHVSDSFPKNAFEDRYDPSESLDICEDDISSDPKYIKQNKFYDKELR